jgi:hypothetical protein
MSVFYTPPAKKLIRRCVDAATAGERAYSLCSSAADARTRRAVKKLVSWQLE